ncbi:MAG TPA: endonuclease/exonuclease/phosphatase family protein, partial [Actinomycetota bacterium]|nr:endonuclease/exonuclease/phosphatase family protein [Actinomycetota bacterium]
LVLRPPAARGALAVAGAGLVAAGVAVRGVSGPAFLLAPAVGLPASTLLLARVLAGPRRAGFGRTAAGFAGGGLLFVALAFVYQAAYDLAIPFPNAAVPAAAAVLLAVPGLVGRSAPVPLAAGGAAGRWPVAVPLALLVVPLGLALARSAEVAPAAGPWFRVVDYNVHNGVSPLGEVDPEAIARVIEAQDPDVVILQEVARGWVTNGMMDLGEWLSARLRMPMVFGPAADRQFGNAILSRLPIVERGAGLLGRFGGTMDRGYVWAVVDVAGARVEVIGAHLAHRPEDRATRLRQIGRLLEAWGGRSPAVIAGDMNAEPGSPEIERFLRAGLRSAQELAGAGDLPTFPSTGEPIDHIFATEDLSPSGFARPSSRASDHLPIAVTLAVAPRG